MITEDGYIIRKCLNGDTAAFGLLVDKYKASVYALAYSKLRNFHDAEDVTQEVFTKAYQKLRSLRCWDSFLAWVYAITANLCKQWIRSHSRRPDSEFIADLAPDAMENPAMHYYREESICESIREALDSLPEKYQQALTLHYLGGMTVKEISRFLGVCPRTVTERLRVGRSRLEVEMTTAMRGVYRRQRLREDFTLRIMALLERMGIQPVPRTASLPWGFSLAVGVTIVVLTLGSHLTLLSLPGFPMNSKPVAQGDALRSERYLWILW